MPGPSNQIDDFLLDDQEEDYLTESETKIEKDKILGEGNKQVKREQYFKNYAQPLSLNQNQLDQHKEQNQQLDQQFDFDIGESDTSEQSYRLQFSNNREYNHYYQEKERFNEIVSPQIPHPKLNYKQPLSAIKFSSNQHQQEHQPFSRTKKAKMRQPRLPRHAITPALLQKLAARLQTHHELKAAQKGHLLPLKTIAEEFHLSPAILSDFYRQSLIDPLLTGRKIACSQELMLVRQNQTINFIDRRIQALRRVISINCRLTMNEMSPLIFKVQQQQPGNLQTEPLSKYGVRRIVKRAGFKRKFIRRNPLILNTSEVIMMREIYAKHFVDLLKDRNNQIYFVGTERFHIFLHRLRGWALKEDDPCVEIKDNRYIISLFCGVSRQKILFREIRKGALSKCTFFLQLASFLQSILREDKQKTKRHFIVFENAYATRNQDIYSALAEKGNFCALYLPPGSPTLNPVEKMFRKLRNQVFQARIKRNQILFQYLGQRIKQLQFQNFTKYYEQIGPHLELSLRRQPLT